MTVKELMGEMLVEPLFNRLLVAFNTGNRATIDLLGKLYEVLSEISADGIQSHQLRQFVDQLRRNTKPFQNKVVVAT